MIDAAQLQNLSDSEIRALALQMIERIERDAQAITWRDAKIDKLTFEMAQLKRLKFGVKSERLDADQKNLFDETVDADMAAIEVELADLNSATTAPDTKAASTPKRTALPEHLPRIERHHEPESTKCQCGCQLKRIGQDISEKLDYTPGVFTVERHIRGKWAVSAQPTQVDRRTAIDFGASSCAAAVPRSDWRVALVGD